MDQLPDPLTPPDCDLRDLDGFMLNVERLLASELWALSNGKQLKAALALWCRAWKQVPAASLPNDDRVLSAFAGLQLKEFRVEREIVMRGFVLCCDGRLYHRTLSEDALRAMAAKRVRVEKRNADTERLKRWREQQRNESETRTKRYLTGQDNTGQDETGTVSKRKSIARKRATRARKGPLPPDFAISPRVEEWAAEKGHTELSAHLEHFRSKAIANGYAYADWDEAFMGAIRNDWAGLKLNGTRPARSSILSAQEALEAHNREVAGRWMPPEMGVEDAKH